MTDDPHKGGVRPSIRSLTDTQRVIAVFGTALFILALIIVNAILAVVCARHGDYERASVHVLAMLAGVVMAFTVDYPN